MCAVSLVSFFVNKQRTNRFLLSWAKQNIAHWQHFWPVFFLREEWKLVKKKPGQCFSIYLKAICKNAANLGQKKKNKKTTKIITWLCTWLGWKIPGWCTEVTIIEKWNLVRDVALLSRSSEILTFFDHSSFDSGEDFPVRDVNILVSLW